MKTILRRDFIKRMERLALTSAAAAPLLGAEVTQDRVKKIRVGQIGTKHGHASGKMGALRKLSQDYEVVGIVEADAVQRRTAQRNRAYKGLAWMTEEQLLERPDLKAVAVETDVADLIPVAQRCVERGLHIHLDKPPGASLGPFKKVLDTARANKVVVQMGYMLRYNPAFQFLYQVAREGWLGDLFEVHAVMSKAVGDEARKRLSVFSGGGMFELGCHLIDSMVTLLGKPQKVTPYSRPTRPGRDGLADNQLSVFEYGRAIATIRIALVEYMGQRRRQFVVCGDRGTVDIKPLESGKMQVAFAEPHGEYRRGYQSVELPPKGGRYDGEFADLAKIIRGEKAPDWGPEHDLTVQEAVLRAAGMFGA